MTTTGTCLVGPFWERKVRTFFRCLDADGDGYLTKGDFVQLGDRYAKIGQLDDVKSKQVHRKILKVWDEYYEPDTRNGKLDEENYIKGLRRCEAMFFETAIQWHGLFFDLIDLNGDGFIQKEEFEIFHSVFGIKNKDVTTECFKAIDTNGDGKLSYDEFTHAGYQFFGSGDESLPSKFLYGPIADE